MRKFILLECVLTLLLLFGHSCIHAQEITRYVGAWGKKIQFDSSGNRIVLGQRGSRLLLIKYNGSGRYVWGKLYAPTGDGGANPCDMVLDANNNIFVVASVWRGSVNQTDIVTIKYNSQGVFQWAKNYSGLGNGYDAPCGMKVDANGNVYVLGTAKRLSDDIVAVKYDANGTLIWVRAYNSPSNDRDLAVGLALDSSNNLVVLGKIEREGAHGTDCLTWKLNGATGEVIWVRDFNTYVPNETVDDIPRTFCIDSTGSVMVAINIGSRDDTVFVKYSPNGSRVWEKRITPPDLVDFLPTTMMTMADGTLLVVGGLYEYDFQPVGNTYTTNSRGGVVRIDQDGTWNWVYDTAAMRIENLNIDGAGNIIASGNYTVHVDPDGTGDEAYSYSVGVVEKVSLTGELLRQRNYLDPDAGAYIGTTNLYDGKLFTLMATKGEMLVIKETF